MKEKMDWWAQEKVDLELDNAKCNAKERRQAEASAPTPLSFSEKAEKRKIEFKPVPEAKP